MTLQEEVAGRRFDPALAAAGQAVILAQRPGVGGVQALAWRRRLAASGPDDPKLREFAEAWLGQGPAAGRVDRRPHQRAQPALVVGDVDLPDRGRATAVAAAGDGVDRARR